MAAVVRKTGGFFVKVGQNVKTYFVNLYTDYSTVIKEAALDIRAKPQKGVAALGAVSLLVYAAGTNPDREHFAASLVQNRQRMTLISDSIRNPESDAHLRRMTLDSNSGLLRRANCVFFSLLWRADYSSKCDLYASQCKSVKPKWRELPSRVVDVGAFGRWLVLDDKMKDYDVNPTEFASARL